MYFFDKEADVSKIDRVDEYHVSIMWLKWTKAHIYLTVPLCF